MSGFESRRRLQYRARVEFLSVPELIDMMRRHVSHGARFEPDNDMYGRTVGFVTGGARWYVRLTALRKDLDSWPPGLRELMFKPGRWTVAVCVNHGHGFTDEDQAACPECWVREVMEG